MKTILLSTCFLFAAYSAAAAAECGGTNARVSAAPITVHKLKEGPTTMYVSSSGGSMATMSDGGGHPWQTCSGIWIAQPDGSGHGHGHCYSVDDDGDIETISWEGKNGKGTWAHVHGTGKFEGRSSTGTWESGKRYPNGLGLTHWKGTCG